ncbi:phycobiliprotein lyase [Prochlorococcus marinus]|uniref:phycobiliprotein lyase n=1 Tax=Prochlorococcus marinus TaxID=1219 RepID=UPI0022B3F2C4|nr:phycobiliprotein lyase [Prochlorococcus marinus]
MNIEEFFLKSVGEWNSMRSGHSLAFQEFDEIRSKIKIVPSKSNDSRVIKFLKDNLIDSKAVNKAFLITWEAKNEWGEENQKEKSSGESIIVPIEISKTEGKIIRSVGYAEAVQVESLYKILEDGTLIIYSNYSYTFTEERIWFVSNNLRSRSSVTRAIDSSAILQTSYASEIRSLNK